MPKIALSDLKLRSLPAPEKGQIDYWDDSLKGFGVRVSQGGSRTFMLNLNNARRTIGRYGIITLAEARLAAKKILAERTLGYVQPERISFEEARDEFLAVKKATRRPRTYQDLKRFLTLFFTFKGAITQVTHREVSRYVDKITAPSEKRHAIVIIKGFFRWCAKPPRRYVMQDPAAGLEAPKPKSRKRVLTDVELKAIWEACSNLEHEFPSPYPTIVKLLILTGQRRGEIAALHSAYYSHNRQAIILPEELTKNHREHLVALGPLAISLIPGGEGLYFPARGKDTPFNGWSKAKAQLDNACGVTGWTLHDLRRTFRTNLSRLKIPPHISERVLNHVSKRDKLEDVYDLYEYYEEKRDAVVAYEAHLRGILGLP